MTIAQFTEPQMLTFAGRAIGRIDRRGRRGTEHVTYDEIEAMAAALVCMGVKPLGEDETFETTREKPESVGHRSDGSAISPYAPGGGPV